MTFLKEILEQQEAKIASHIRPEIQAMANQDGQITQAQLDEWFKDHGMNSYERELLYPKMDNEALCNVAESCLKNVTSWSRGFKPASTYEEAICTIIAPLLLERLKSENSKTENTKIQKRT